MLQLRPLDLTELTRNSEQWDDLWHRSESRLPSEKCAGIQLWCKTFAPQAELEAIVVESDDRWIGGLSLVKDRSCWPFTVYRLPSNHTVRSGDLLIDPECDVKALTGLIAGWMSALRGTLITLEGIQIDSERWKCLISALRSEGRAMHLSPGHEVGVVDILHDWNAYKRSWSANHRSAIKRSQNKLEATGEVACERVQNPSDAELYEVLEMCFAIEHKGWKGENGTSILSTPRLREYYHEEARMMRDIAALDLWLLKLNGRIIAFEYCHLSKGICLSHKISFDPDFDRYSPGKVLRSIQLEQLHQDQAVKQLDTLGVLCEAKAKWITRKYQSSRCFVAIGGHASNLALRTYKSLRSFTKLRKPVERPSSDSSTRTEKAFDTGETQNVGCDSQRLPPIACPDAVTGTQEPCL